MDLVGTSAALHVAVDGANVRNDTLLIHAAPRPWSTDPDDETSPTDHTSLDHDDHGYRTSRRLFRSEQNWCVEEGWYTRRRQSGESWWCLRPGVGIVGGGSHENHAGKIKAIAFGYVPPRE